MPLSITNHFISSYARDVFHLAQQRESRLLQGVTVHVQANGDRFFVNNLGTIEASLITDRGGDSPSHDLAHDRRMITFDDYEIGILVDKPDILKTNYDPTNDYTTAVSAGMGRQIDSLIITALGGTSYSGATGGTANTLAAANQIAVDYVETGAATNSGLTVGKLRQAANILGEFEIPEGPGERYIGCTQQQITDLLRDDEATNRDYNSVQALVDGRINYFMGFTFLRSQLFSLNSSTDVRTIFAWGRGWLHLGIAQGPMVRYGERPDKRFNPYLYTMMSLGATRMEEKGVVEISADESP